MTLDRFPRRITRLALIVTFVASVALVAGGCDSDGDGGGGTTADTAEGADTAGGGSEDTGATGSNPLVTGEPYVTFLADGAEVRFGPDDLDDAKYFASMDRTNIVGPDGGAALMIQFAGTAAASLGTADVFVSYDLDNSQGYPWGFVASSVFDGSEFTVDVSAYGQVGEWVTGTFSGTLVEMHESEATGATLTITEGAFALIRGNDKQ